MKYLALVQARCGSTRLPAKVLKDLSGKTVLERVVERVKKSRSVDETVVITSIDENNLPLIALCAQNGIRVFVGAENDVLDRFYQCARLFLPEYVIRITADCPLIDWRYIDLAVERLHKDTDYMGQIEDTFPDGLDVEIIRFSALKDSWKNACKYSQREHVTLYLKSHPDKYVIQDFTCPISGIEKFRWTVDEAEDYTLVKNIYEHFQLCGKTDFVTEDVLAYLRENPALATINSMYKRNEGAQASLANDHIVGHLE